MTGIENLLEISAKRGITFSIVAQVDGETSLKVSGPPSAVKLLRSHIEANEAAIIQAVQAGLNEAENPSPVANRKGQGERGGEADRSSVTSSAPTPLSILSQLHLAGQFIPGMPAAIDLALWLTEAVANSARDENSNVVDAGVVIDSEGRPVNVAQTVAALARGPQLQGSRQTETPASWLERIAKFKALLDDQTLKWRASTGWRSAEWPAEAKKPPRPVALPKELTTA